MHLSGIPRKLCLKTVLLCWGLLLSGTVFVYTVYDEHSTLSDAMNDFIRGSDISFFQEYDNISVDDVVIRGGVKSVVILTYQRCGSTFYGEILNKNQAAFYVFEPLDAVYSTLYGTKQGFNGPSDINTYRNGTQRILPAVELNHVSRLLAQLFSCDAHALPVDSLSHIFWTQWANEFSTMSDYAGCLRTQPLNYHIRSCDRRNPWHCAQRFGDRPDERRLTDCRDMLAGRTVSPDRVPSAVLKKYVGYRTCLGRWKAHIEKSCGKRFTTICNNTTIRAAKVVRASMSSMDVLLNANPDFHVIHLLRDPRAVVASRKATHDGSIVGMFAMSSRPNILLREAVVHCRTVVADILIRRRLEEKYPGRIMTAVYEDMVDNVEQHADLVYRFLGLNSTPPEVKNWIDKNRKSIHLKRLSGNYTSPVEKWKKELTASENTIIVEDLCREYYRLVNSR